MRDGRIPSYDFASIDNLSFADETVWATATAAFKPEGKVIGRWMIGEATNIPAPDACYDYVLSAHQLEHCANPLKALAEFMRVMKPGGDLVLVLPNPEHTFDHRRPYTTLEHLKADFLRDVGEDDLTHFGEIMHLHDLEMDRAAPQTVEGFALRSLQNASNRCLHHHVFSEDLAIAMLHEAGFHVERQSSEGEDMIFRAYKPVKVVAVTPEKKIERRRLGTAVFSTWSSGNRLQEYVKYYLERLLEHFERVDVVSNEREIVPADHLWLAQRGIRLMLVPNNGRDFGMWYQWMMREGAESVISMDRLALVNDSCICFGSLDRAFEWGNASGLDIWGLGDSNVDNHHIQSYFLVLSKRFLPSVYEHFLKTGIVEGHAIIQQYECGLSQWAVATGHTIGSLAATAGGRDQSWSGIFTAIIEAGAPVIKRTPLWADMRGPLRTTHPMGALYWRDRIHAVCTPDVLEWFKIPFPRDPNHTFRGREPLQNVRRLNSPPPPAPRTLMIGKHRYRMANQAK